MSSDDAVLSWQRGDFHRTRELCASRLASAPDDVHTLNLFAMACANLGEAARAVEALETALAIAPEDPTLHNNLGNALLAAGRCDEAIETFKGVAARLPQYADGHFNLGNALLKAGRPRPASQAYRCAIDCDGTHARAYYQLGNALRQIGEHNAAAAAYDNAAQLMPGFADALQNQAACLVHTGQFGAALGVLERLILIRPESPEAHYAMGLAQQGKGALADAADAYAKAATLTPHDTRFLAAQWQCGRQMCRWDEVRRDRESLLLAINAGAGARSEWIPALSIDARQALALARRSTADHGGDWPPLAATAYGHAKIRVAYLMADQADDQNRRCLRAVLDEHDRDRFEITEVVLAKPREPLPGQRSAGDPVLEVHDDSDADVARWLRDAEIDIAVDLAGRGAGARGYILARRPAPVQVQYLGFGGSLGLPHIDYLIADEWLVPVTEHDCYTEKLAYLPAAYCLSRPAAGADPNVDRAHFATAADATADRAQFGLPADATADRAQFGLPADATADRAHFGLAADAVLFCCLSSSASLTAEIFDLWMRLLERQGDATLCLLNDNPWATARLVQEAADRGIGAERLRFVPPLAESARLRFLAAMDVYLDTPDNGWAMVADALRAAVPTLSLYGTTFWQRRSASLLHTVGLSPWVVNSLAEYEHRAAILGADGGQRRQIRDHLSSTPALAAVGARSFARQLEQLYQEMLSIYAQGQQPRSLRIGAPPAHR